MTLLADPRTDLVDFEADVSALLAIEAPAQDILFRDARTANAFTDEPVTDAQMRAIYDLAKWGPTAMNTQPLRIVLVRSDEARQRLAGHMAEGNRAKTSAAPLVAVLAADLDFHDELHRTLPAVPNARDNFSEPAARESWATMNATLQAGYFIVGVRAAGLAAGPMGGFDADGLSRELFPDGRHRALLVVNLGQPAEDAYRPRQPRLDFDDVVTTV